MSMEQKRDVTRRGFFRTVGATGAAVAAAGLLTGIPRGVHASVDALIAEHMGPGEIAMEKVTIHTPATAEDGALVRMPVSVDHPMDPDNYIESLSMFVDDNPAPLVAKFDFTPAVGKVDMEYRIKMAKASKVRAIAKTNTGKLYGAIKEIYVAAGGCSS